MSDSRTMKLSAGIIMIISRILDGRGDEFRVVVWLHDGACSLVTSETALCALQNYTSRPPTDHAVSLLHHNTIMLQKRK
jgi:hypothetical protein